MTPRDDTLGTLAAIAASGGALTDEHAIAAEQLAEAALSAHAEDPEVVIAASAVLLRVADRRGLDAPTREEGPASRVARATAEVLAKAPPELQAWLFVNRANALRRLGPGRDADARTAFRAALDLDDSRPGWWLDLALLHKWRGRWRDALEAVEAASSRGADPRRVAFERAIAGTALAERELVLAAWESLGVPMEVREGGGWSCSRELPPVQVRVPAKASGHGIRWLRVDSERPDPEGRVFELVWVTPLSPVHGVVSSPTFEDAPVDYGDVILWDAAPVPSVGEGGPVFPLLEILGRGEEHRLRFVALVQPGELDALLAQLRAHPALEVRSFAHVAARGEGERPLELVYGKWLVPPAVDLAHLADALTDSVARLRDAEHDVAGIRLAIPELYEPLDTERAGKEHQAWRTIEKLAEKRLLAH